MAWCKNCKCEYINGVKFCKDCGLLLVDELQPDSTTDISIQNDEELNNTLCKNCGKPIDIDTSFCQYCGTSIKMEIKQHNRKTLKLHDEYDKKSNENNSNNINKKLIILISSIASVFVIGAIVTVLIVLLNNRNNNAQGVDKNPTPTLIVEAKPTTVPTTSPDITLEPTTTTAPEETSEPTPTTAPEPTSEPTPTTVPEATSKPTPTTAPDTIQESTPSDMSDDIYSFQLLMDGVLYQFPMTYSAFAAHGWTMVNESAELSPNSYKGVSMIKNDVEIHIELLNLTINNIAYEECLVGGVDTSYLGFKTDSTYLPGGIQYGVSTIDEVIMGYGNPTSRYDSESLISLTYTYARYQEVVLDFYGGDVLTNFTMQNFIAPDEFDYGSASDKVPDDVLNYVKPTTLGNDLLSFVFALDGNYYKMPFPVSEMIANGWKLDEANSKIVITAGDYEYVTMRMDNKSFKFATYNTATYATYPNNCWIKDIRIRNPEHPHSGISTSSQELVAEWELPLGLKSSMSQNELEEILVDSNHIKKEEEDYIYYTFCLDDSRTYENHITIHYDIKRQCINYIEIERNFN